MLNALQSPFETSLILIDVALWRQATRTLLQHCQLHRQVKPVENMLSVRVEILRQPSYRIASIREEGHLLVCLHSLRTEQLKQAPLWLRVVPLHKREAFAFWWYSFRLVTSEGQDAFSGNDLEQAAGLVAFCAPTRPHDRSIQSHRERSIRNGQPGPAHMTWALRHF